VWIGIVTCLVAGTAVAGDYATLSEDWEKRYNAGDAAGVAALYTTDGVVMPPEKKAAQGPEAITAMIKQDLAENKGNTLRLATVEYGKNGSLGFARGTFKMLDAKGDTVAEGKWIEVRKKVGGKWLIHNDIWNVDAPAPHVH